MHTLHAYHAPTDTKIEMLRVSVKYMNRLREHTPPRGFPVLFDRTLTVWPEPSPTVSIDFPDPYEWIEP